jgi:hypothetical protein
LSETHTFLIHFRIPDAVEPDEYAVRAYDDDRLQDMALAGPDEHGQFDAEFDRDADSFPAAVGSAIQDLSAVFPEAEILSVDADNLVSIAAIARRLGRSHEGVRLYARGKRGPGNFPAPAGRLDAKTEVWRWPDVALWWQESVGEPVPELQDDLFLTVLNDALEMRRAAEHLEIDDEDLIAVAAILPPRLRSVHARR